MTATETEKAGGEEVSRGWLSYCRNTGQEENTGNGAGLAPECPSSLLSHLHKAGQGTHQPAPMVRQIRATRHEQNCRSTLKHTATEECGEKGNQNSQDKIKLTH